MLLDSVLFHLFFCFFLSFFFSRNPYSILCNRVHFVSLLRAAVLQHMETKALEYLIISKRDHGDDLIKIFRNLNGALSSHNGTVMQDDDLRNWVYRTASFPRMSTLDWIEGGLSVDGRSGRNSKVGWEVG